MKQVRPKSLGLSRLASLTANLCLLVTPLHAQGAGVPERLLMFGPVQDASRQMDSLEQVALNAPSRAARGSAVTRLAQFGRVWVYHKEPSPVIVYTGIVNRMRRIYPTAAPLVRETIVASLLLQAERSDALTFLAELARSPDEGEGHISLAEQAVEVLSRMGAPGETELRRLHLSGEANAVVQDMLDGLSLTGYRHRPPR